jgi:hypothetical protein
MRRDFMKLSMPDLRLALHPMNIFKGRLPEADTEPDVVATALA